eukprot:TRINITY_DN40949_c0_g1_i1.p1 TRINITY_DN40949_c0_g1~~TRINITY_DN40949_c0_g1_i1.p1  ORF type:complete len:956 (+),score=124.71 TRINITY_DN40949_c0_g1_i1:61-2928(+)
MENSADNQSWRSRDWSWQDYGHRGDAWGESRHEEPTSSSRWRDTTSWRDDRSRRRVASEHGDWHSKKVPCKFGENCKNQDRREHCARFSHPHEPPLPLCWYGADCRDQHRDEHCRKYSHPQTASVEESSDIALCKYFSRGLCNQGDTCRFAHPEKPHLDRSATGGRGTGGNASNEVLEEVIADSAGVRAVYGLGGKVTALLFPDECISVEVRAKAEILADTLRARMSEYGELRAFNVQSKGKGTYTDVGKCKGGKNHIKGKGETSDGSGNDGRLMGGGKGADILLAHVTFMEKASAARALVGESTNADLLGLKAGGVQPPPPVSPIRGFLNVMWNVGDEFENMSDSDDACETELETWTCGACTFLNPVLASSCEACEGSPPRRVIRKTLDDALRLAVPMIDQNPKLEPFFLTKQNGALEKSYVRGFRVYYVGEFNDVQRALRNWGPNPAHLRGSSFDKLRKSLRCAGIYQADVAVDQALFEWWGTEDPNLLQTAMDAATKNGVKVTVRKSRGSTNVRLSGRSLPQIQRTRSNLLDAIASDTFIDTRKDLLFAPPARKRLRDIPFFIKCDFRTRTVRVYGTTEARKRAESALQRIVTELATLIRLEFTLKSRGVDCTKLQRDLDLMEEPLLRGKNLTLWVPADSEDACRTYVGPWIYRNAAVEEGAVCALCLCEFDEEQHRLLGCGHSFCTNCLTNTLREPSASHFPFVCQGPSPVVGATTQPCRQPFCWADLVQLAPSESLAAIKDMAVQAYLLEHPEEGAYCGAITNSGCNAIVRPKDGEVACAGCGETYCINCSTQLKKPVVAHHSTTCEVAQLAASLGVHEHRRRIIDECLTIRCPKCAMAFDDFVACAALTCASCNAGFCAKCLIGFWNSSSDTHKHVKECSGGGNLPTGYFVSIEAWHKNNLRRAKEQVEAYLEELEPECRDAVILACDSDFKGRPGGDLIITMSKCNGT